MSEIEMYVLMALFLFFSGLLIYVLANKGNRRL